MQGAGAMWKWLLGMIILVVLAFVAWRYVSHVTQPASPVTSPLAGNSTPAHAGTVPEYPISAVVTGSAPPPAGSTLLPPSDGSDTGVSASLSALPGADGLALLLVSEDIIPRIVATVDALPGKRLSEKILPVKRPAGAFVVNHSAAGTVADPGNAARYAAYVNIAKAMDTQVLVNWYVRNYLQFQQAYRQLGYPEGHFNDRLVAVIDNLLQAPDLDAPARLVPHKAGWAFADNRLESLSAGQKLLLRISPSDEAQVKQRLRALRNALAGAHLAQPEPAVY